MGTTFEKIFDGGDTDAFRFGLMTGVPPQAGCNGKPCCPKIFKANFGQNFQGQCLILLHKIPAS